MKTLAIVLSLACACLVTACEDDPTDIQVDGGTLDASKGPTGPPAPKPTPLEDDADAGQDDAGQDDAGEVDAGEVDADAGQ